MVVVCVLPKITTHQQLLRVEDVCSLFDEYYFDERWNLHPAFLKQGLAQKKFRDFLTSTFPHSVAFDRHQKQFLPGTGCLPQRDSVNMYNLLLSPIGDDVVGCIGGEDSICHGRESLEALEEEIHRVRDSLLFFSRFETSSCQTVREVCVSGCKLMELMVLAATREPSFDYFSATAVNESDSDPDSLCDSDVESDKGSDEDNRDGAEGTVEKAVTEKIGCSNLNPVSETALTTARVHGEMTLFGRHVRNTLPDAVISTTPVRYGPSVGAASMAYFSRPPAGVSSPSTQRILSNGQVRQVELYSKTDFLDISKRTTAAKKHCPKIFDMIHNATSALNSVKQTKHIQKKLGRSDLSSEEKEKAERRLQRLVQYDSVRTVRSTISCELLLANRNSGHSSKT